jgi:ribosome-binding protein aMBF1 (putative translation factor)
MTRLSYPGESRSRLRSSPACASIEMLRGSGNELRTKEIIDAVKETVGRRIGRLREEKGLSQRELAEGLPRVGYAFISRVESGQREPSLRTLRLLAERLGVTALYLETGSDRGVCPHCGRSAT